MKECLRRVRRKATTNKDIDKKIERLPNQGYIVQMVEHQHVHSEVAGSIQELSLKSASKCSPNKDIDKIGRLPN